MASYHEAIAAGLCGKCKVSPLAPNRSKCRECLDKTNVYSTKLKKQKRAKGLCRTCSSPLENLAHACCDKCIAKVRVWVLSNKRKGLCGCGKDRAADRKNCQKCIDSVRTATAKEKQRAINAYGGKCACIDCEERNVIFLQIDHINNEGAKHRREIGRAGYQFYIWLRKRGYPSGYQVLCGSCNGGKSNRYTECPHSIDRRKLIATLSRIPLTY